MNPETKVRLSRFLSMVLRHKPEKIGIQLDSAGWVDVDDLLRACSKNGKSITREDLKEIVADNDKQRFAFSSDDKRIRANQGHSISIDLGYHRQCPPAILFHGTATRFIMSIKKDGLLKRGRHHVHLSASVETASVVGKRHGSLAVLEIDAKRMHEQGFEFYLSANGVWLTDRVPPEFINFQ